MWVPHKPVSYVKYVCNIVFQSRIMTVTHVFTVLESCLVLVDQEHIHSGYLPPIDPAVPPLLLVKRK